MSSTGLPRLDIDVRQRRADRWIAVTAITLALLLPVSMWPALMQPVSSGVASLIGVLLALACAVGFQRAGWLGGAHRIARVVWSHEGHWLVLDAGGTAREVTLAGDTRVGPGCVWLRWQGGTPRSLLLTRWDLAAEQLRRLSVRLRIDHDQAAALPRSAAI